VTVDAPGTTGVVIENGATLAGSTVNAYMALVMEGWDGPWLDTERHRGRRERRLLPDGGANLRQRRHVEYRRWHRHARVDTTTIGHNQSADPLLVNSVGAAAQDFHIASAGSPVIGAGTADAANGSTDRDGVPHPDPPAIGASQC
jgi:hypothetical protein